MKSLTSPHAPFVSLKYQFLEFRITARNLFKQGTFYLLTLNITSLPNAFAASSRHVILPFMGLFLKALDTAGI